MVRSLGRSMRAARCSGVMAAVGVAAVALTVRTSGGVAAASPAPHFAPKPMALRPHLGFETALAAEDGVLSTVPAPAPPPAPPLQPAGGAVSYVCHITGGVNGFTYGYCTWWVAHKRPVPWRGNAWEWWGNARQFGFVEGQVPRVGAIMVVPIGGWSPQGHVAYVETVNTDGSFTVSEMNWGRWGVVDLRHITALTGIVGFIY